jgi:hypothetical protein
MNLHPSIRAEVETEVTKERRVPFMAGCEIGRLGRDEGSKQILALQYLRAQGARLTGEQGRDNVKNVVRAIQKGELTKALLGPSEEQETQKVGQDTTPELPLSGLQIPVLRAEGPDSTEGDLPAEAPEQLLFSEFQALTEGPTRESTSRRKKERPVRIVTDHHFAPRQIRETLARLEPTQEEPLETSEGRAVLAVLSVILGVDPTGEGLMPWSEVYAAFKPILQKRSVAGSRQGA